MLAGQFADQGSDVGGLGVVGVGLASAASFGSSFGSGGRGRDRILAALVAVLGLLLLVLRPSGSAGRASGFGSGADSSPPSLCSPTTASTVPTSTVSSSWTRISSNTPAAGEGISVSTLSVEISSKGSSASTCSPTCFNQRLTVPSVTLSPSAGRVTSVPDPPEPTARSTAPNWTSAARIGALSAFGSSVSDDGSGSGSLSASAAAPESPPPSPPRRPRSRRR